MIFFYLKYKSLRRWTDRQTYRQREKERERLNEIFFLKCIWDIRTEREREREERERDREREKRERERERER